MVNSCSGAEHSGQTYLRVDVKYTPLALRCNVFDGLYACPVEVLAELCVLDERVLDGIDRRSRGQ